MDETTHERERACGERERELKTTSCNLAFSFLPLPLGLLDIDYETSSLIADRLDRLISQ